MRRTALLTAATLALAACAGSEPAPLKISGVRVEADLSSIGSSQAATYWSRLDGDLESAIAAQFLGRIDPAGNVITVDVDELSLNSPFLSSAVADTARLSGRVEMLNPAGTSEGVWNVSASAQDVAGYLPPGTTSVAPTSAQYYHAIVQAFASGVATTVQAGQSGG